MSLFLKRGGRTAMEFSIQSAPSGACRFSRAPSDLKYACVV